jgi:dihydroxy-acid dehydratase
MSRILGRSAFENAIRINSAIGGSSNAAVHLLAIAGRLGIDLTLADFDAIGATLPCIANLRPAGDYLMEDFFEAGGLPAVIRALSEAGLFDTDAMSVNGRGVAANCADAPNWNPDVIRPIDTPFMAEAGLAVLRGNLAPDGAIIKPACATPDLMTHSGPALVFDTIEDLKARIDDPDLAVAEDSVLVLRNCGPRGYPGMPEVANLPIPKKLLDRGVRDMVRISDARMSGTAYGTVVMHVAPEAAAAGPLALVRDGDRISLDVPGRRLHLHVADAELAARRTAWVPPAPPADRGYVKMYVETVMQADRGADLDFLVGRSGSAVPRDGH